MGYLSQEFLSQYKDVRPENAGPLFEVTYLSKYSRWIEEKSRRETWLEIIQRLVEYNIGLYQGPASQEVLVKEAELMFDNVFHLRTYPAGRSLWIAGTEAARKFPESNLNCTMLVIQKIEDFCDLFHLLMVGAGVGYRILKEDVDNLPTFTTKISIYHSPYIHDRFGVEKTTVNDCGAFIDIEVGDSKEGWVEALRQFLLIASSGRNEIDFHINYNNVRPAGERIKTFGGRAAGPNGLKTMFNKLVGIIKNSKGVLSSVDCMDICNIIAENVLVGGVRRSAQIALGSHDDQEFIDAKLDLFDKPELKHRRKSNNSIVLKEKPTKDRIKEILQRVRESWEPGFLNHEAASKRRPNFAAVNPCGEILGADKGNCNLSGTYVTSHVKNGKLDMESLEKSHRLATRIALRLTNIELSLPHWNEIHKRDRLLGVSITGWMDALDRLGWDHDSTNALCLKEDLRRWANDEADKYSYEMRVNRPLLVTTVKPEGTISLLTTVSCGMHRSYAPQFIRRYKVSNMDPLCKALKEVGVPNEPDKITSDRTVFEFYINSGAKISANEEPALDQFRRYVNLMRFYVDHNASCTLTVGPDEWDGMSEAIYQEWDNVVAIALANKEMSENTNYVQLPYEAITKEQMRPNPDLSKLHEIVNKYENVEYEDGEIEMNVTKEECAGGQCPIR